MRHLTDNMSRHGLHAKLPKTFLACVWSWSCLVPRPLFIAAVNPFRVTWRRHRNGFAAIKAWKKAIQELGKSWPFLCSLVFMTDPMARVLISQWKIVSTQAQTWRINIFPLTLFLCLCSCLCSCYARQKRKWMFNSWVMFCCMVMWYLFYLLEFFLLFPLYSPL